MDVERLLGSDADDRPRLRALHARRDGPDRLDERLRAAQDRELHDVADPVLLPSRLHVAAGVRTRLPSTATITSSGSSFPTAGSAGADLGDARADRRSTTFLPAALQRDGRRDLLRQLHVLQVELPPLRVVRRRAGRSRSRDRGRRRCAVRRRAARAASPCGRRRRRSRCRRASDRGRRRRRRAVRPGAPRPAGRCSRSTGATSSPSTTASSDEPDDRRGGRG